MNRDTIERALRDIFSRPHYRRASDELSVPDLATAAMLIDDPAKNRWTEHDIDSKSALHAIELEVRPDSFLGEVAAEIARRNEAPKGIEASLRAIVNDAAAKVAPDLAPPTVTWTSAQLRELLIAPERSEGGPCCADCAPIRGEHAPYRQDFNSAPLLKNDLLNPVVGTCPACGKAWMVPAHVAIARLSALVSLLLRDRVERLSPDEWEQRLREVVDGT